MSITLFMLSSTLLSLSFTITISGLAGAFGRSITASLIVAGIVASMLVTTIVLVFLGV